MDLSAHLASLEDRYDSRHHMLGRVQKSAGYHTTIPDGQYVHDTRGSLAYAVDLLASGREHFVLRACQIVRKVLALQDTNPTAKTYGIWPYLLEEPLPQMAPPDWNWADFCGAQLLLMLADHAGKLPADLLTDIRAAVGHAAWSLFRRNVQPDYTNIAVMGAGVALAAGEILGEGRLVDYGRTRLANVVSHTEFHGGFHEYNSPTYTMVVLRECERMLHLVRDASARADAETLRRAAWATIAEHFHPPTGQWAGPHSRAYADLLGEDTAQALADQTGVAVGPCRPRALVEGYSPVPRLPCPADLVGRFGALPADPLVVQGHFYRDSTDDAKSVHGTTWLTGQACLGTVNRDALWTQRRCLIGYWPAGGAVAVLRMRFLHDGKDFASATAHNAQAGPRVLSLVTLDTGRGSWHLHLDRPADGTFGAEDFRLRYELTAPDATAEQLDDCRFALTAGGVRVIVHTLPGLFDARAVRWQLAREPGKACLDAVCYHGPRRPFTPADMDATFLAAGLELLADDASPAAVSPAVDSSDDTRVLARWELDHALKLSCALRPGT